VKLVLVLDGERREVEVDLARNVVRVGAHEWPVQVGASAEGSLSFEILGERVEVRGDPRGNGKPSGSITVNGELHTLVVESSTGAAARAPPISASYVSKASMGGPPEGRSDGGPGTAIFPPMPGKVLEVRVHDGDRVEPGQVLLVLEAMKMRNEVTSPVAGSVSALRVTAGANVAARDVLLRVLPL
jgi:glutaconyl-CoA/methylmalonyl-CoA decarboxylase subunit gamma